MKKLIILTMILFSFKFSYSQKDGLRYVLPEDVAFELGSYISNVGCDTCEYYGRIETFYDTVIFLLHSVPYQEIGDSTHIKFLIQKSNRYTLLGDKKLPILLNDDFLLGDFFHTVYPDGRHIGSTFSNRTLLYIMYVRKRWGEGQIIELEK